MSRRTNEWMNQKGSKYRNKIAFVLNKWRHVHSIRKLVGLLNISQPTIQQLLKQSKRYLNSNNRHTHICDQDIEIQLLEKNSKIRNTIAIYLKLWRKYKSIHLIAKSLNITNRTKIRKLLKLTKAYPKTHYKKYCKASKIENEMNQKNSQRRKKVAGALNCWRKNHSVSETSKNLKISYNKTIKDLALSKKYQKSIHRYKYNQPNYSENQMKIKNSKYRKQLAKILHSWKIFKSTKQVSKKLNISNATVIKMLNKSKRYNCRKKYKESETNYIGGWSKKIWIINLKGGRCEKCENKNIFVLEFHHTKKNKEKSLSELIWKHQKGTNIEKIKKEALKCQLLCRNCHQEIHNPKIKSILLKKELMKVNGSQKCILCGYSKNIACMEFHHPDQKTKTNNISKIGRSFKKIHENEDEIK